jgi:sec-independent protein translocase protein TatC
MSRKLNPIQYISHVFNIGLARKARRQNEILGDNPTNHISILDHIQQLRQHVMRALIWLILFASICFAFMKPILSYLKKPYEFFLHNSSNSANNLTSISIFEVMTINFKICFFIGFAISLPFIIWELWKFVSPALYASEKKIAFTVLVTSILLFYTGLSFGYFLIIPYFFQTSLTWASNYANVMITYESYFNTLTTMLLIFATIFEVPVILSLLGLVGILPSQTLAKNRRIAFLVCFIIGAILAPPDVLSLCLVSIPMYVMIEVSIYCLKQIEKRKFT